MYEWLSDRFDVQSDQVVTGSRRLARTLSEHFAARQVDAGKAAWRQPRIHAFGDWLDRIADGADPGVTLPVRINAQQSCLLWEQCLGEDIDDPLVNIAGLARLCFDTWTTLNEWRVPLVECQSRASGVDQRIFARAAGHYVATLDDKGWIDDALLGQALIPLIESGSLTVPRRLLIAGFDRRTPAIEAVFGAAIAAGSECVDVDTGRDASTELLRFENADAELRAAGAWARRELDADPALSVAIVVSELERDAERCGRLIREGLAPGWQYAADSHYSAVNVSYGRRLGEYPAVEAALLLLCWLYQDAGHAEVSLLLRSPFFGTGSGSGRGRLELALRDLPDRGWTRQRLLDALSRRKLSPDAKDWLQRLAGVDALATAAPRSGRPADWAALFDRVLAAMGWPGEASLSSADFQLVNRWRDLLNEFARLDLVRPWMKIGEAVTRLTAIAAESVFQPQADAARVAVLGPLEAAGMQFDRLRVTGMTADIWPPPRQPLPLISRELQRDYGMPDSTPQDTASYAARVLQRLGRSAPQVVFSYAAVIGDADQRPTLLLGDRPAASDGETIGWNAERLVAADAVRDVRDRVPAVRPDERLAGGASAISMHDRDPFAAFARGRLGIRRLQAFKPGITPSVRGNLIHEALFRLYRELPSSSDIDAWDDEQLGRRISAALAAAFRQHERHADALLGQLLGLEKRRTRRLLHAVVQIDRKRGRFVVDAVETEIDTTIEGMRLTLRCDRIDRLESGEVVILDYKTGQPRAFLTGGQPASAQLVVYANALDLPVAGLGLFNVDSRETVIDGVGPALAQDGDRPVDDFRAALDEWQGEVIATARQIAGGDVRLNVKQSSRDARPYDLLSRFAEVRHEP